MEITDIKNVTIIGAGTMGHGIAQVALLAGYNVTLVDVEEELVDRGVSRIKEGLKIVESKGRLTEGTSISDVMGRLTRSIDLQAAVKDVDFVFEAVSEDMETKQVVFEALGEHASTRAVLASNTSALSMTKIGESSKVPERVIGMHFFHPVMRQCCVEVMAGEKTSKEALDIGVAVGKTFPCLRGKRLTVRIEKDCPGFIANRLLIPPIIYISWILDQAFEKGIPWEQIDADAGAGSFIPMGPCELNDYLGMDSIYKSMKNFEGLISPDFTPGKVLTRLVEEGNLGRKTGKSFYDWTKGKPKIDLNKKAGLLDPEIILAIQLNEGCRLLEEEVVTGYKIIDDVMLAGTSMPGPFSAGKRNYGKWSKMLEDIAEKMGRNYVKPCNLMKSGGFIKIRK